VSVRRVLRASAYRRLVGVGGIGTAHVREVPDRPPLFSIRFQHPDGSSGSLTAAR
jgi:hypothetical protein